jgi:predicted nucleic acid-binding protein
MMTYVLDACALIALIKDEEGADAVQHLIEQAINEEITLCMSMANFIEVHYQFYRDWGKEASDALLERIYAFPIQFYPAIDAKIFYEASRLKAVYFLPLGDAIGLATAISLSGVFVTADGEFIEAEEKEYAPIHWFRPPKKK